MAFTAGDILCCSSDACVLIDTNAGSASETWDLIPHVTLIAHTETATTPKLVTSSSAGAEISACGTVTRSGSLSLACHNGVGPGMLCINDIHRIRWAQDCDQIWTSGAVVGSPDEDFYFEAVIRITSVPVSYDIAGNAAIVLAYTFDIVRWVNHPSTNGGCQTEQAA
jgi:hypothetical protein